MSPERIESDEAITGGLRIFIPQRSTRISYHTPNADEEDDNDTVLHQRQLASM